MAAPLQTLRASVRPLTVALILIGTIVATASASHVPPTVKDVNMANLPAGERELSIAVDPNDPNHLAAGANQRPGTQHWYTSTDGGRNWDDGVLPNGTLTVPGTTSVLMSDPSLDFGSNGEIYYSALMHGGSGEPCTLFVSVSTDDGANWTDPATGIVAAGTMSPTVCQDKEHIVVDRGNSDNVYVGWTPIGGANDQTTVFSRDLGGIGNGLAFSAPFAVSTAPANAGCLNQGADFALTGSNLYVAFTSFCSGFGDNDPASVWVARSTNQGVSFGTPVQAATLENVDFSGLGFRSRSFPSIDVDAGTGRVFVAYGDYAGSGTNADVMLVSAPADLSAWTGPVTVNQNAGTSDQWMPWIDVGNGRVHVDFYTRAYDSGNINLATSYGDVAASPAFTEIRVSSASTPTSTGFLGDYNGNFVGSDDVLHPAWGDGRAGNGGSTDAWTARVDFSPPTTLALAPLNPSQEVGTIVAFTATVTGAHGEPEQFIPAQVSVTSAGTPSSTGASGVTNASGTFGFSYTNTTAGVDTLTARADLNEDGDFLDPGEVVSTSVTWTPGPPATLDLTPATDTNTVDDTHQLTATVKDQFGNLVAPVLVRFSVSGANGVLGIPTSGSSTTVNGIATFSYVGVLPGNDTITAYADFNSDGVRDPNPAAHEPQDTALKTWNLPPSTEGAHVTGAGAIDPTPGGVGKFTFNPQKKQSEPSPTGKLDYEAPGLDVRSTSITAIVQSGNTATFFGIATIGGSGSFVFRVDVVDGGEPSSSDHFRIRLSTGYDSGDHLLTRGNIQTH
jgi:hypothetical protein